MDPVPPSGLTRRYPLCGDPADTASYRVAARHPGRVTPVATDRDGRPGPEGLLPADPGAVYACGPDPLLADLERAVPADRLYRERFAPRGGGTRMPARSFTAALGETGEGLHVPADRTLLDAVRDLRPDLDSGCERGVCGECALRALRGTPDRRDAIPTDRSREDMCVALGHPVHRARPLTAARAGPRSPPEPGPRVTGWDRIEASDRPVDPAWSRS